MHFLGQPHESRRRAAKASPSSRSPDGGAPPNVCLVPGCLKPYRARGMCSTHYEQWRKGYPLRAPSQRHSRQRVLARDVAIGEARTRPKTREVRGWLMDGDGYVRILRPEHPYANAQGYVLEHRLVFEEWLGRYLGESEVVHHIDGDRSNNARWNLMLFRSPRQHLDFHRRHHCYSDLALDVFCPRAERGGDETDTDDGAR